MINFKRIKELRIKLNYTQAKVANEINITDRAYRFIEAGDRELSIASLVALSNLFNVSTDYLLGLSDNPNRNE